MSNRKVIITKVFKPAVTTLAESNPEFAAAGKKSSEMEEMWNAMKQSKGRFDKFVGHSGF